MEGNFPGEGGAKKVEVRGLGATLRAGEKCCWLVLKAGLSRGAAAAGARAGRGGDCEGDCGFWGEASRRGEPREVVRDAAPDRVLVWETFRGAAVVDGACACGLIWAGGRSVVAPVSAVAVDLVLAWPAPTPAPAAGLALVPAKTPGPGLKSVAPPVLDLALAPTAGPRLVGPVVCDFVLACAELTVREGTGFRASTSLRVDGARARDVVLVLGCRVRPAEGAVLVLGCLARLEAEDAVRTEGSRVRPVEEDAMRVDGSRMPDGAGIREGGLTGRRLGETVRCAGAGAGSGSESGVRVEGLRMDLERCIVNWCYVRGTGRYGGERE